MPRIPRSKQERLTKADQLEQFMSALDDYIDEKIRYATSTDSYYSGQVFDTQNKMHEKLRLLLDIGEE